VYGDDVTPRPRVFEWHKRFCEGREEVDGLKVMLIVFFDIKGVTMTKLSTILDDTRGTGKKKAA